MNVGGGVFGTRGGGWGEVNTQFSLVDLGESEHLENPGLDGEYY